MKFFSMTFEKPFKFHGFIQLQNGKFVQDIKKISHEKPYFYMFFGENFYKNLKKPIDFSFLLWYNTIVAEA